MHNGGIKVDLFELKFEALMCFPFHCLFSVDNACISPLREFECEILTKIDLSASLKRKEMVYYIPNAHMNRSLLNSHLNF